MGRLRRKHAILVATAGLIASVAALIGLRIGRPVYYSDGNRALAASELRHAGMLRWDPPRPEFALPGPVRGRVAQLPDGRLLYGLVRSKHRTDLVLFDPAFSAREPEPVVALCSEGHDLAPAVTGDGDACTLWFASDRAGGAGGFDLYRARYRQGTFYGLAPLDLPGVNTFLDETDPAPHPATGQLVFVRRDPGLMEGRSTALWIASLAGAFEPRTLLPADPRSNRLLPVLDRDPAFSPSGKAVYFLRQPPLEEPLLLQTFQHRGEWVQPLPVEIRTAVAEALRGPALLDAGFDLRLVQPGSPSTHGEAMTYRSRAREVRPYWDGQLWIESLLVSLSFFFFTLLVLLTLGARWHQLDLITKLFLVSVAIHLLLLLWLSRMEIVRSFFPDQAKPGDLQVTILAAAHGNPTPGTGELVAQTENIAQGAAFHPGESALSAAAPGVTIHRQERAGMATPRATPRPELRPALAVVPTDAEPAPVAAPARRGRSREPGVSPATLARTEPARPRDRGARRGRPQAGGHLVEVTAPGSDIRVPSGLPSGSLTGMDRLALPARLPRPRPRTRQGLETPFLRDLPATRAPRARVTRFPETIPGGVARITAPAPTHPVAAARPKAPDTTPPPEEHARPGSSLVARHRGVTYLLPPHAQGERAPVEPGNLEPGAVALEDKALENTVVERATKRSRAAKAGTPAEASAAIAGSLLEAVAQAEGPPTPTIAKPDHDGSKTTAPESAPPPSFLGQLEDRRQHDLGAIPKMLPERGLALASPIQDLEEVAGNPNGASARSVPSPELPAAVVLPGLGPTQTTPVPEPHRFPDATDVATGGLEIPGSFLDRARRRPWLPESWSAPAGLDAGVFRNRFGPQKAAALRRFGGGEDTERAVRLGLDYLARIQNRDGSWGRPGRHSKYGRVQVGKTALCLLAFLGAGHTHQSGSRHRAVAQKALDFLLEVQDETTGHFGATSTYSHGIATYALAECYAMTRDKELEAPLEYAVAWTLVNQNYTRDRRNRGGWGYFSPSLRPEDSYARASTTAWQVMALKSAQLSGIKVSAERLRLAEQFLWRCYDRRHRYFLYTHKPSRLRSSWRTLPASTPASCFCLLLLGNDPDDARLQAGLEYTLERRPRRYARHGNDEFVRRAAGNVYFWYYGSLAAFLAGGESWRTWNGALKGVLLKAQSEDGSFAPIDVYAEYAGDNDRDRSYTTAMCVLSLEVYYRYFTPLLRRR